MQLAALHGGGEEYLSSDRGGADAEVRIARAVHVLQELQLLHTDEVLDVLHLVEVDRLALQGVAPDGGVLVQPHRSGHDSVIATDQIVVVGLGGDDKPQALDQTQEITAKGGQLRVNIVVINVAKLG